MDTKDILQKFFEAENSRDWETYQKFLHDEVVWQLFNSETKNIEGIDEYMKVIKNAYKNQDIKFTCKEMKVSNSGNRIAACLINDLGKISIDIFDFKDNLIYREYEFILD
ncbi:nuclear transport factor 2 family protein [Treponema putidum]|uniref:nuclear transport factor 2 family protein n=1 Tax=Treponema putidum TaxID=221027 RepID=UPI0004F5FEC3|nr:nuclear transport factor 2 family protein [Treponema putidum]AIN93688.1 hypothetical protein JO40_05830 [Treponema putidum]TWI77786.1 SnoaL-like protein [Treponema putidum]